MTKNKNKKIFIISVLALIVLAAAANNIALASVPVHVTDILKKVILQRVENVGTVETIKDISDMDELGDLQTYIFGEEEYTSGPTNVSVTKTQKIQGTETDISMILDATDANIKARTTEIIAEKKKLANQQSTICANGKENSATCQILKEKIAKYETAEKDLQTLKDQLANVKNKLKVSVALDVNIVSNSAQTIEDLKAIAKEELARTQVGKITEQIEQQYNAAGVITDWKNYLYGNATSVAQTYLNTNFKKEDYRLPFLDDAAADAIHQQINKKIKRGAKLINPIPKPDAFEEITDKSTVNNISDPSKGGGWDSYIKFVTNLANTADGQMYMASRNVANAVTMDIEARNAEAQAGGGVLSVKKLVENATDKAGQPVYEILVPGSIVGANKSLETLANYLLAADPKYASPNDATYLPGGHAPSSDESGNSENGGYEGIPKPQNDVISGKDSFSNIKWWDSTFSSVIKDVAGVNVCSYVNYYLPMSGLGGAELSELSALCSSGKTTDNFCESLLSSNSLVETVGSWGININSACGIGSDIFSSKSVNFAKILGGLFDNF